MEGNHQNGNVVNILKRGDWITLINGTSTTDKDEAFFEKVKTACCDREDGLSLVIKTPAEQQEFHLWDPKPVKIDIKTRRKILPCTLEIFYPVSKAFNLVKITCHRAHPQNNLTASLCYGSWCSSSS